MTDHLPTCPFRCHPDVQELTADDLCIYMKEMATDDIATSVHGLMSRSHAETGG